VKLDRRSIPYRIVENGARLGGIVVFSFITSSAGSESSGSGFFGASLLFGLIALGMAVTVGWEYARFKRYRYDLTDDTFDIHSGVLSRRDREIPYERIQNVDISQNIVQRFLDIAEVRLETAGGSGTEAQLRYVSSAEATRLQEELSRRKRGVSGEASESDAEGELLFELSDREHVVLGIVSADLRLLGVLTVAISAFAPQVAGQLGPEFELVSIFGPVVALGAIVVLWVASAILQIFRYYGFRLTQHSDELRYERGLLQRYSGTVPLDKVQTVTLRENVLARALGYASLVIQTAGYAPGQGGSNVESAVPIAERNRAVSLAQEVEPFGDVEFTRPPKRARTRYAARYTLVVLGLTAILGVADSITGALPRWYVPLAALAVVPLAAHLTWKHRGYYADDDYVVTRRGFWRRNTMVVPYDRVQTVFSSQTIFQRRRDLGTVTIDTAGSGGLGGGDAVAVYIDATVADQLREDVADRLQRALRPPERQQGRAEHSG
jgi:putative membrane protein